MRMMTLTNEYQSSLDALRRLQAAKGRKEKENIVAQNASNDTFLRFLTYACHPRKTYKVSESTLLSPPENIETIVPFDDFFEMCDALSSRKALDDAPSLKAMVTTIIQN